MRINGHIIAVNKATTGEVDLHFDNTYAGRFYTKKEVMKAVRQMAWNALPSAPTPERQRYVVGTGIRADLCEACWLATVDHAAIERADAKTIAVVGEENGNPAAYDLLIHAEYVKIHPHRS